MRRIFLTTLITSGIATVLTGLYIATMEKSFDNIVYFMIFCYGNIIIPTLPAVIIFSGLTKIIKLKNLWTKMILDVIVLGLIIQLGLWVWATADVVFYYGNFDKLIFQEIKKDYYNQFIGWTSVAITLAVSIPLTYGLLKRKEKYLPR